MVSELPKPDPVLKRLERLVGKWILEGRSLHSEGNDVTGQVTIDWLPGGFFLQQRGEIQVKGFKVYGLEIVGYDPATKNFPSYVFSNIGETVGRYYWDVEGDVVTHWTAGAKYTGRFNKDGNILSGGWRPDKGVESSPENTYDATMIRVK